MPAAVLPEHRPGWCLRVGYLVWCQQRLQALKVLGISVSLISAAFNHQIRVFLVGFELKQSMVQGNPLQPTSRATLGHSGLHRSSQPQGPLGASAAATRPVPGTYLYPGSCGAERSPSASQTCQGPHFSSPNYLIRKTPLRGGLVSTSPTLGAVSSRELASGGQSPQIERGLKTHFWKETNTQHVHLRPELRQQDQRSQNSPFQSVHIKNIYICIEATWEDEL